MKSLPRFHRMLPLAWYGALGLLAAWVWWGRVQDLGLEFAAYGVSPMAFVYKQSDPQAFARDFAGGVEQLGKSAPMLVYPLAYRLLEVAPERVYPVVVAVEILLMAAAMVALTRTLRPDAPAAVGALVAALVIASGARNVNLAAFRQPFFWGLFYNVADALRLFALVALLRGRAVLAGGLMAGSFVSHPAMGLMGAAFAAAAALAGRRELSRWRAMIGAAVFVGIAGLWTLGFVGGGAVAGGEFPKRLWFDLTRLVSYHWYPVESGFFTTQHRAGFLPFLSFLMLLAFYMGRSDRKVAWGMAVALALAAFGVLFSVVETSPALVKLALQRANDMVVTVGLVYVVAGLWAEIGSGRAWREVLAALALASPFVGPPGFPLAFSVGLSAPTWRGPRTLGNLLTMLLGAGSALLVTAYAACGTLGPLDSAAYAGLVWVTKPWVLAGLAAFAAALLARRWAGAGLARAVLAAGLACSTAAWVQRSRLNEGQVAWASDYKAVQLWAREHTPRDALFMIDPALGCPAFVQGWRDYARRSSFGVLREWLYTSWFYTSDYAMCQEGLRRLGELGVDVREFMGRRPPSRGFAALADAARRAYYTASDEWRLGLARRYGIGYFVFEKQTGVPRSTLPRVFENARFLVLAAGPPGGSDAAR